MSAGLLQPKKRDHALARRQLYLNYGALTLATLCDRAGFLCTTGAWRSSGAGHFRADAKSQGSLRSDLPLMLSMPSFYALGWAQAFCCELKQLMPALRIVIGGRWVTGPDPIWLKAKLPEADEIVRRPGRRGLAEFAGH